MISEDRLKRMQIDLLPAQKGHVCVLKSDRMLEVIDLALKSFRFDREADWLVKRMEISSIMNRCRFCPEGIKQHAAICQCTKTWRDIARQAVEMEK